jgi:serine/threonine protein kinase
MPNTCLDRQVLEQFLLGQLEGEDLERVAQHVEQCGPCIAILYTLRGEDTLVEVLRDPAASEEATSEDLERLIARLRGLCPPANLSDTSVTDPALLPALPYREETTQEFYDFLAPPLATDEIGRLGTYRVLKVLGVGGMGVVFHAEDPQLQRPVALKTLKPILAASPAARRRFLREARATAALVHEHIVAILHVGEDRGIPYLAMPLLAGETLQARLKREGKLPLSEVLRIGLEVAEGLTAAHQGGIIHRDIKPANIFLTQAPSPPPLSPEAAARGAGLSLAAASGERGGGEGAGPVKILDFGLARAVSDEVHLTQSGLIVGTPAYMAPEQAHGEAQDARCDLFSLGAVLYHLCTGEAPFKGANTMGILRSLEMDRPKAPHLLNPAVPPALSELILQLLAKRPQDRPATARAVVEALDSIQRGRTGVAPSRRRRLALRASALLAGVILLGLFFSGGGPQEEGNGGRPRGETVQLFAPAVHHSAGLYPNAVTVADFNGDGKLDLAVTNVHSHSVSVLLGKGDGTFQPPRTSPAGEWFASSVTVGDFDGDGKPDLVVANSGSHTISVLRGKGDGTFHVPVQYGVGTSPNYVAVADLNGDGRPDLVVSHASGNVSILLGKGDGTFRDAVNVSTGAGNSASHVAVADLNGDGKPDLAVAINGGVSILLGNGDGTFHKPVLYHGPEGGSGHSVAIGDFNGDGKLDLALSCSQGLVLVLLGRGDGTFHKPVELTVGALPHTVVVGDFNGDGKPDLATANEESDDVSILLGNGDGTFQQAISLAVGRRPYFLVAGDFNGDGQPDLAVANYDSNNVSVLIHRPPAPYRSFLGPAVDYPAGAAPHAVAVGDLDRDGRADVVTANRADNSVSVLRGKGDGTFAPAVRFATGKGPVAVVVADVNGDGRPDLVTADSGGDTVSVLLGNGDGTFRGAVSYATGKNPLAVAVADINRDGKPDLVVADYDDGTVSVLLGRGDGTFHKAVRFPAGGQPRAGAVADFNGDGKLDLALANRFQVGGVSVLLGKGDGTFQDAVRYPAGSFPVAVVAADFNRDGKIDLAVLNWGSQDVNVFLGKGDGTFPTAVNYPATGYPVALVTADLDGAGKLDLTVAGTQGNAVWVLPGNSGGTFRRPASTYRTGLFPQGIAAGDFNRDGRPDVVVANAHSDNVSVLLNRPAAPYLAAQAHLHSIDADGTTFTLEIAAYDAEHNADRTYDGTVRCHCSDRQAVLPGDYTFGPGDKGTHYLSVTLQTPGSQTIRVEDTRGGRIPGRTAVRVLRLADLRFKLAVPPKVVAGKPFNVNVNVYDPTGIWTNGYRGTVHFACTDKAATLPGDYKFSGTEGVHTFTNQVTLRTPGEWSLTVTDTAFPGLTATVILTVQSPPG